MASDQGNLYPASSAEVIKQFQLLASVKEKKDPLWGKNIAKYISSTVFSGISNGYFWIRNSRFKQNRDMAAGRMSSQKFMDMMEFNGKFNYLNLNWQAIKIVQTIISKMVGRWMGRNERIIVTATDSLSVYDKQQEYDKASFYMDHKDELLQLQQQSGIQMIPKNQFIANDQEELDLWAAEYQRLPEEILQEQGTNDVLTANGMFDDNKEKLLHDSLETGLISTYTYMDDAGVIHVDWVKPENHFYSYSEYPDLHDCTWMGDVIGMKISDIRRRFGKEFGGDLTEEQLWDLAQNAKEYQLYDKLRWLVEWNVAILRPYDEWNLDVVRFEIKSLDSDPYTLIQTKQNKSTIIKNGKPSKLGDNEQYIEDKNQVIYQGLFVRQPEMMLSWGLKQNMIRPQDPKEVGNSLFSYSTYMYQNQDMRNIAVPEKIQQPVEAMILTRYRMQQLVMRMRPTGTAINVRAMREVQDFGLGDKNQLIDPKKYYDQTGDFYYSDIDAEGNPIPIPFQELQNNGFLGQMQGLIQQYEFQYKILKDELGEDPSIVTSATKPRVAEANVQASQQAADDSTDYMYDAYLYVMEETAKKISCLLHDSIVFGSNAYRDIMQEKDVRGRAFATKAQMLPDQLEIAKFENMLNQAIQSNPDFILYCDTFKILRIAKEDVKLAEIHFRQCMKKMIKAQQEQTAKNAQDNANAQQQAVQMKGQQDQQLEQLKSQFEASKTADLSRADKEKILLTGFTGMWANGTPVPPELKMVESELIKNIVMPLFAENQANQQALQSANQMNQMSDQDMQDAQSPPQQQPQQNQPQIQNNQPPQPQQAA